MLPALFLALRSLRPAFSRQRTYELVSVVLLGLIFSGKYTTLTTIFLQVRALLPGVLSRYWSVPKMLSRRQWSSQTIIRLMLEFLQATCGEGFILADVTHTTTQGRKQQARHFRPNPKYRPSGQNQSKFLAGNSALTLAFVVREQTASGVRSWVFGLGCVLLRPGRSNGSEVSTLRRAIAHVVPHGMTLVYDRGGNDATTINAAQRAGRCLVTRLNANAVFYRDPECRRRIDPWSYRQTFERDKHLIYRNEFSCYRKKVRGQLKVVVEIFYNSHRRRWQAVYYMSTDTSMGSEQIVNYYRQRSSIEQVHADSKAICGFNSCRLHTARAIEGYLTLSILACGMLEYLRYALRHLPARSAALTTSEVLRRLGMHWYHPTSLTRGLTARYLDHELRSDSATLSTFRAHFSRHIAPGP